MKKKINIFFKCLILGYIILTISIPTNVFATNQTENLSARNLAMFASIAYADLENISDYDIKVNNNINKLEFNENKMVTDNQLKSIISSAELMGLNLSDETEDTYTYLFYNLASTNEVNDWEIVNYTKVNTTVLKRYC